DLVDAAAQLDAVDQQPGDGLRAVVRDRVGRPVAGSVVLVVAAADALLPVLPRLAFGGGEAAGVPFPPVTRPQFGHFAGCNERPARSWRSQSGAAVRVSSRPRPAFVATTNSTSSGFNRRSAAGAQTVVRSSGVRAITRASPVSLTA